MIQLHYAGQTFQIDEQAVRDIRGKSAMAGLAKGVMYVTVSTVPSGRLEIRVGPGIPLALTWDPQQDDVKEL